MKKIYGVLGMCICATMLHAQETKPTIDGEWIGKAHSTGIKTTELAGVIDAQANANAVKWKIDISKIAEYKHGAPTKVDEIKAKKNAALYSKAIQNHPDEQQTSRATDPTLGTNFLGNNVLTGTPPDNAMAISNGGKIVTIDNSTIEFYNDNGSPIMTDEYHDDWLSSVASSLSLTAGTFDPRVIYDPDEDKFILVLLHGSSSTSSKVLVCFSQSNNPNGNWNVYSFSGNPLNDNSWFDYPNIGISDEELFITGNLFQGSSFNESIIYQIDKSAGYSGQSVTYDVWDNIPSAGGLYSASIVPASYGHGDTYGPGIYMVSAASGGYNKLNFFDITDDLNGNPDLDVYSISVPYYDVPADANQSGASDLLSTNDCRMQHAFYLNGMVHAVHHADYTSGYTGIKYYRIPVSNLSNTESASFGLSGYHYAYPALASYGNETVDLNVMIGFMRSGSTIFPEIRVVNCDNYMDFSNSTQVKQGTDNVDILWGNERWGDYTDMQRRHSGSEPTVWMSASFGSNSGWSGETWNTWIAEIEGDYQPVVLPIADFVADTTWAYDNLIVNFTDSTTDDPYAWQWSFEGGSPPTATVQNPISLFSDTGWFDVQLIATNQFGSDTILKEDYIHILTSDTIPETPEGEKEFETNDFSMNVYPNPVQQVDMVQIDIDNPEWSTVDIDIVDLQGRIVKEVYADQMRPGVHRLSFNKLALSPGAYFVRVVQNDKMVTNEKVIVQ